MKSIEEIQNEIVAEFNAAGDSFDQYELLIKTASRLRPFTSEARKMARIVQGCQSSVWLSIQSEGELFDFSGYSHSAIINGMITLLEDIFCGQTCKDVAQAEIFFLEKTAFMDTFESERAKGVRYMIRSLQEEAGKGCRE